MARSIDRVTSMLVIPLCKACGLVHVLDNLSPTNARVVSAEGNLTFLRAVGNHAHLCATEVVIKQILKPHALDTENAPDVVRIILGSSLHAIVAIGAGIC